MTSRGRLWVSAAQLHNSKLWPGYVLPFGFCQSTNKSLRNSHPPDCDSVCLRELLEGFGLITADLIMNILLISCLLSKHVILSSLGF